MNATARRGPRNRPRAKVVCTNCRSRKIKCDAEKLAPGEKCTPCQSSQSTCRVDQDCDRRKSGATQQKLAQMQDRIRSLEGLVGQKSLERESVNGALHNSFIADVGDNISVNGPSPNHPTPHNDSRPQLERQPSAPVLSNHSVVEPNGSHDILFSIPTLPTMPPTVQSSPAAFEVHPPPGVLPDITRGAEAETQTRRESDANDMAFYGLTTQPHLRSPDTGPSGNTAEDVEADQDSVIDLDSAQLGRSLLTIFFRVQRHAQVIVQEDLFRKDRNKYNGSRSRYYSPFLESAILATAARHSTSSAVRSLSSKFASRSKCQITQELEEPQIATLQGFLLLSDFEATQGRARVGWSFSCIAASLLVDLSLHVDASQYAMRFDVSQQEIDFRRSLLLGTFVYSTLWSLYLGRPISMSSPVLRAVRTVIASYSKETTLYMWVQLCLQMLDIIEILNEPPQDRRPDRMLRLCSCEMKIQSTFDGLPAEFTFEDGRIDALDADAYAPYMQYWGIQIMTHRNMAKTEELEFSASCGEVQPKSLDHINAIIHENAVRIAKLVQYFQQIFGVEAMVTVMLDNIFVAAVALISHILRIQKQSRFIDKDRRWLRSLFQALVAVEKHYPITRNMRSSLTQMVVNTPISDIFPERNSCTSPPVRTQTSENRLIPAMVTPPHMAPLPRNCEQARFDPTMTTEIDLTMQDDMWMHYMAWNIPVFNLSTGEPGFVSR